MSINTTLQECSALGNDSIDDYIKKVMQILKICPKASNELIGWHHYNDYKGVSLTMNKIQLRLHTLISNIFNHQDINLNIKGLSLDKMFDLFREGNDALFERINNDLDEASGIRRDGFLEIVDSNVRTIRGTVNQETGREISLLAARNIQKPQIFFATKVNNSAKEPFIPRLKEKPNSIKPLSILLCIDDNDREYYSHPYIYELQHWAPAADLLSCVEPIEPRCLEETSLEHINTREGLVTLIEELIKCKEIAVDLEHHGFRSYLGLTCLIQISTREKDYLIDPFPLMDDLVLLNEVFTNPKITKVFHGSDSDMMWLQRDFSVYVVNMFDTHQAAVVLDYPHRSLSSLMHLFCSILANKKYQRADWRTRPLPADFIEYAQQDTHNLLYIYDCLRNELINNGNDINNLLNAVYNRSTEICMKRFDRPLVGPYSHLNLYRRSRKTFNNRQLDALKETYLWRDKLAREQDESVDYILPNHMMLQLSEVLPKEMQGIFYCCNPIPINVKTGQLSLHQIFRTSRELPLEDISVTNEASHLCPDQMRTSQEETGGAMLISKHDLSQVEDNTSGLSTLLNPQETLLGDLFHQYSINCTEMKKSKLFGLKKKSLKCKRLRDSTTEQFLSPFERYTLYLEMEPTLEEEIPVPIVKTENLVSVQSSRSNEDCERMLRLQQHIECVSEEGHASLSKHSTMKKEVEQQTASDEHLNNSQLADADCDLNRLNRLQDHIASVTEKADQSLRKQNSSAMRNKKISILDMKQNEDDGMNRNTKRKSCEIQKENKKYKTEEKSDDDADVTNGNAIDGNDADDAVNGDDASTPFDYPAADYSIFSKNKGKNKNKKIKEKFKGKSSNKSTGAKKGGLKKMSWGMK